MNILLFGPPGSGKGTQSAQLVEQLKYRHISTGDLFRAAIKNKTALGQQAQGYLDKGQLVPDTVTIGLVKEVLESNKGQQFILDGFPRNIPQAEALSALLSDLNLSLDKAIFLDLPKENLKKRLVGRRVCRQCGATYHVESMPPKKDSICDLCGGEVYQRADDKDDVIETRLTVYESNTAPLKDFYKRLGLFKPIDGLGSQDEVYSRLKTELKN